MYSYSMVYVREPNGSCDSAEENSYSKNVNIIIVFINENTKTAKIDIYLKSFSYGPTKLWKSIHFVYMYYSGGFQMFWLEYHRKIKCCCCALKNVEKKSHYRRTIQKFWNTRLTDKN